MLKTIVIMLKRIPGIVRGIYINTFHLSGIFLFQSLECKKIVPVDQHIPSVGISMRFFEILDENSGFKPDSTFLANPSELEFLCLHVIFRKSYLL